MLAVRIAAAVLIIALPAGQDPEREKKYLVLRDTPEAEMIVRTGDVDNLGFGWPQGFDPYSGMTTKPHRFPYKPSPDDPDGTDRIMIPSSHIYGSKASTDGYTRATKRPDNNPRPVVLEYDLGRVVPKAALLRLFVDFGRLGVGRPGRTRHQAGAGEAGDG
jgi:hypothetical protein